MKKLLIVDDEIMVRVGMRAIIDWESCGYTVIGDCANGAEALEAIGREEPDLVLTDLKMEKMDGFELIETCRRRWPEIRFIIMSNYNDFENTKKAIQLGAIDYIFKLTVTPEELKKTLQRAEAQMKPREDDADRLLRRNITAIKSYLIQVAAEGSYRSEETLLQDLHRVCPANDFSKPYCVMQVSADSWSTGFSTEDVIDLQLLKYGLENMLAEVMNQNGTAGVYSYFREDFLIVFSAEAFPDYAAVCDYAGKCFLTMKEYVKRYFSLDITAALSSVCTGIIRLREAVEAVSGMLAFRTEAENGILHTANDRQRPEIAAIRQYVRQHLAEDLSLEVAAREANMSQSYFSHVFKDEMKISFTDFVNRTRMQAACQLLKNRRLKVNEVAAQVGIENFNYFSVLFKKTMGVSPNAYREQLQAMEEQHLTLPQP